MGYVQREEIWGSGTGEMWSGRDGVERKDWDLWWMSKSIARWVD